MVLTCPAVWGPYRREQFDEVPALAGLSAVRVVTDAEAAAVFYATARPPVPGETVAVYDLGDGRHLYVVNDGSENLTVIDTGTNRVTATVPVGREPWSIAVDREGRRAYVTNATGNSVTVLRTAD